MLLNRVLFTLMKREFYRFSRLAKQTIFPPLLTTILFIVIFGFSLGGHIKEIEGWPYIVFILPGLAALGVVTNAYSNTSTSLYAARFDNSIENLLSAPISPMQMVIAQITSGVLRGLVIGILTLGIASLVIDLPLVHPVLTFFWIAGVGVVLACLGIVSGLRADSWDKLATMTNFILTPGTYLGGVFYSIKLLPQPWQTISMFNPILYYVDGMRYAVLGTSDMPIMLSVGVLVSTMLLGLITCWYLFLTGYKLVK